MANNTDNGEYETDDGDQEMDREATVRTLARESIQSRYAAERLAVDTIFEMLTNPGRRYVLTYLAQSEGYATLTELVDYVMESTKTTMTDEEFRQRVTVELTQTHLPALDEAELVDYNMERQLVSPTELTPLVQPYLRVALAQQQVASTLSGTDYPDSS